jgi:hypothetical protein
MLDTLERLQQSPSRPARESHTASETSPFMFHVSSCEADANNTDRVGIHRIDRQNP